MSEAKRKTVYLRGTLYWVKILDAPRPNFDGDAREWTMEFEPDAESKAILVENGVGDRLRDRKGKKGYEDRNEFIILRRNEFKTDGTRNDKIRVVDAANQEWHSSTKIGNGTTADVKVQIVDWGPRKKMGIYPLAVRVLDLVSYTVNEFEALPDDDPRVKAAKAKDAEFRKDFGIADDDQSEAPNEPEEQDAPFDADTPEQDPLDDDVPV
jgi:hypothetical protein